MFGCLRPHSRFYEFSSLSAHPPTIHFLAKENVCYYRRSIFKGFSWLKVLSDTMRREITIYIITTTSQHYVCLTYLIFVSYSELLYMIVFHHVSHKFYGGRTSYTFSTVLRILHLKDFWRHFPSDLVKIK